VGDVKKQLFRLGGSSTAVLLNFKKYDLAKKGTLDKTEFERALGASGLFLTKPNLAAVVRAYAGENNEIQYETFIRQLKLGMNDRRTNLVRRVYNKLDGMLPVVREQDDCGIIKEFKEDMTMEFILEKFGAENHPKVRGGEISANEAIRQMKDGMENGPMDADGDGCVDIDEFTEFYNDISAGIPSDDYFVYVIECVWGIQEDAVAIFNRRLDEIEQLFVLKAKEQAKGNEIEEKAMSRVFKFFDTDGSGELDKDEFELAMIRFGIQLSQKEIDGFFARYDTGGDGDISCEEIIDRVCCSTGMGGFGPTLMRNTPWDTQ
jgi:Ca2+-binding EF-hand superfamily protein